MKVVKIIDPHEVQVIEKRVHCDDYISLSHHHRQITQNMHANQVDQRMAENKRLILKMNLLNFACH